MRQLRTRHALAVASFALFAFSLEACGSSDDGGSGSGGPCSSLQVGGQKYNLLFACDVPNLFGFGTHLCTEYYSNVPQVETTFKVLCGTEQGTVTTRCPTANSFGSCTATSTAGNQGAVEATFGYPDADGSGSAGQFKSDCDSGSVYAPPGAPPASTASSGSQIVSTCPQSSGSGSGVAFSFATLVNGEDLECTNYVGTLTAAQLASVLAIGASTSPCPEKNALCACTKKGAGTFGTDATLVYYKTSMPSSGGSCDGVGAGCDVYTDSYEAP